MLAHGLMFHHFHGGFHPAGQGAISDLELIALIQSIGLDRIISAEEWVDRASSNALKDHHVCLTFDDALLCQFDVALPVLDQLKLTGFWFIYSSIFEGDSAYLEIFRNFRTETFDSVDDFYENFLYTCMENFPVLIKNGLSDFDPGRYLENCPFYSKNDRVFRYLRDCILGSERYEAVMMAMIAEANFDIEAAGRKLWMNDDHLKHLNAHGHIVGMHSYSHPTTLALLPADRQRAEYERNHRHLTRVLGKPPIAMSHPCNSYNPGTLGLLGDLGVQIGFRATLEEVANRSMLEFPREDHAIAMQRIKR